MKGYGADVDTDKTRLDAFQLAVLKLFYDSEKDSLTASDTTKVFDFGERKASSIISNLVGMDLIKSSKYTVNLTDNEEKRFKTIHTPHYWIPKDQGDPWRVRARYVIEINGSVNGLDELQFGLQLWPLRESLKYYDPTVIYREGEHIFMNHLDRVMEIKVVKYVQ